MRVPARSRSTAAYRRMPKRKTTSRTFFPATKSIARSLRADLSRARRVLACLSALLPIFVIPNEVEGEGAQTPSLSDVLAAHLRARAALHVATPKTLEIEGTVEGLGLSGTFQTWHDEGK